MSERPLPSKPWTEHTLLPPLHLPGGKGAPDVFVIGGARCGTTSLCHYLDQHPDIHMCHPDKEPSYYCDIYGVSDPAEYAANFRGASVGQLLGDASTPYLTCPASAGLIHGANERARLIVLLRNPADRAYSLYLKMCHLGHETIPRFEDALAHEAEVIKDPPHLRSVGYHYNFLYFHSGLYSEQLRRYFRLFPADQIFVALFEELAGSPRDLCDRICSWLGLDPIPSLMTAPRNRSEATRSRRLNHWIRNRLNPAMKRARLPWRGRITEALIALNTARNGAPGMDPELRRQLSIRYAEDVTATAELINRDLGHWLHGR